MTDILTRLLITLDRDRYFILDRREIVPVTLDDWYEWLMQHRREIARTHIGRTEVTTVFVGQQRPHERPRLFETYIVGGSVLHGSRWPSVSLAAAENIHRAACGMVVDYDMRRAA
jgi:hypothetical protein